MNFPARLQSEAFNEFASAYNLAIHLSSGLCKSMKFQRFFLAWLLYSFLKTFIHGNSIEGVPYV